MLPYGTTSPRRLEAISVFTHKQTKLFKVSSKDPTFKDLNSTLTIIRKRARLTAKHVFDIPNHLPKLILYGPTFFSLDEMKGR
jgi:hypothetical protein